MNWLKLFAVSAIVIAGCGLGTACHAQTPVLRIGVMNDKQGPYSDASGVGSDIAGRLAIEDMHGQAGPFRVELSGLDHQNKPDIGVALAKRAYEQDHFAALFDISHSAVSLAVQNIARQNNKVLVFVGSSLLQLFGAACSPTSAMWLYDLDQQSRAIIAGDPAAAKGKWFMLGSDYVSGKENVEILRRLVTEAGGTALGAALMPLGESDYSSVLLQAQSSGANVIAITYPGNDLVNAVKQAREFGVSRTTRLMTPFIYLLMKDSFEVEIADAASMKDPWDVFKVLRRIPASEVITPPDGSCHLPR